MLLLVFGIWFFIMGALTTIRDTFFEQFLRYLWLGGVIDFLFNWYAWLMAISFTLFVAIKWRGNYWVLGAVFLVVLLFFKFALGL